MGVDRVDRVAVGQRRCRRSAERRRAERDTYDDCRRRDREDCEEHPSAPEKQSAHLSLPMWKLRARRPCARRVFELEPQPKERADCYGSIPAECRMETDAFVERGRVAGPQAGSRAPQTAPDFA